MDRVLDRDPTYLRTPLVALIAALVLVVPTTAFASDDFAEPAPPEAAAEAGDPAAEVAPSGGEEVPLPAEEISSVPDPVELTPAPIEETSTPTDALPATGDAGGELPAEAGTSPEIVSPIEPATDPGSVENPEPLLETVADPDAGELIFPVAPAPDSSPPVADLSPEEIAPAAPAPAPAKPVAPQPPQPEASVEPSTPVDGSGVVEPVSATATEPDLAIPPPVPILAGLAPDPHPIVPLLPEEPLPEPVINPFPVRPLVVVDPPVKVDSEPVLLERAPITPVEPDGVASEMPVPPVNQKPSDDPIFFPTFVAESGEVDPPPAVALEIPFETSGAPPPASPSGSASSSSSSGLASGVGPAALAALFVVIALGAAATVRLTTQAWRSSYLLSLPERPG